MLDTILSRVRGPKTPLGVTSVGLRSAKETLEASTPTRLFAACGGPPSILPPGGPSGYDVAADGSRVLMICPVAQATPAPITVSIDWTALLKR